MHHKALAAFAPDYYAKFLNEELQDPNIQAIIQNANAGASVLTWNGLGNLAWDRTLSAVKFLASPISTPFINMYRSWKRFNALYSNGINVFSATLDAGTMPFFEDTGIAGVYTGFSHKDLYSGQTFTESEAQWSGFVGTIQLELTLAGVVAPFLPQGKAVSGLTRGSGSGYARTVTEGGTGKAFAGHGELRQVDEVVVPQGSSISFWTKHGQGLDDAVAKLVERGEYGTIAADAKMLESIEGAQTFLPGSKVPNYHLKPPSDLNIMSNSITVDEATPLSNLLKPNMGRMDWAACRLIR